MKIGLTLGKYAPLHKGHQYVIETALAEMDQVVVIVYNAPDVTHIPLPVRANWIRRLYPQVKVIEAIDGPTTVSDLSHIKKQHEDYICNHLGIRNVDAFYCSEFYGDHMSKALNAVNRLIDPEREKVPISSTRIRKNPYKYRKFMAPHVYADFIVNVVFLGAPSTGKTTIAKHLADVFDTVWMPEYGRHYWEEHQKDRRLTSEQLLEIAKAHLNQENARIQDANQYLFTDTNAITTLMFALSYHRKADPRLWELARQAQTRYDLVFVCDTDIPYDDTWDRSGDVARMAFQKQIIQDLRQRKLSFFMLQGDLESRTQRVCQILATYKKLL